ncbi:MAG: hypothetical protein Q4E53_10745 [Eubacteriales bacterium]|nr:hypothetical protein [Eubacteriales bacterium]
MVDIHTHILPGIDDGARNWDDSYRMAAMAADTGVDTIVCTHHSNIPNLYLNYNNRYLDDLFEEFAERLRRGGFPLRIVRGMEIFSTPDVIEKIMDGALLPINGSSYYLIEFNFQESIRFMEYVLYELLRLGKRPIIAHPERYFNVQDQPDVLYHWMKRGVLSQINKGSILGRFGEDVQYTAQEFLNHNLITCIASDAHRPNSRTTEMGEISHFLRTRYSEKLAHKLLDGNPRKIIRGISIRPEDLKPFEVR